MQTILRKNAFFFTQENKYGLLHASCGRADRALYLIYESIFPISPE